MFDKVLIANRGAIACRIIRTLRRMGIRSVAVFSDADAGSLHVSQADEAIHIGPAPAALSYLDPQKIIAAAKQSGAQAIHPGYGFLSENPDFARACGDNGLVFIGPTPENISAFGRKDAARALARRHDVPLIPGSDVLQDSDAALAAAAAIGYPVMLKAVAGGGGIGMRICRNPDELAQAFPLVTRLAASQFGHGGAFLERYVQRARHIEVQIFGDGQGRVLALGERDCSLQRRHQKVVEETPATNLSDEVRQRMFDCAVRLTSAARYRSAGTVEFLVDGDTEAFYFLEVNTRLQVEHGVTEQVTGIDLVEWMVRGASKDFQFLEAGTPTANGASIQVRLYAEDPVQDFRPSSGTITQADFPAGGRIDTWIAPGTEVSAFYDPMLGKLIAWGSDRAHAIDALRTMLQNTRIGGLECNLSWLRDVVAMPAFEHGDYDTRTLPSMQYQPRAVQVLSGGLATSLQDFPGRIGYWSVGVPPSGPMDDLAFRLGNRLLDNDAGEAGIEITAAGPRLQFLCDVDFCLTGAPIDAKLDGHPIDSYAVVKARAGSILAMGRTAAVGMRAYLLVRGGFDVPRYLGSRATFSLGAMGGLAGRCLSSGDLLTLAQPKTGLSRTLEPPPRLSTHWTLRVLAGPHGAPDFFTPEDIQHVLDARWQVHLNSSRTGVRLIGPKPSWARRDGGEAGLHPSNIHDNAYVVGAVDFTGDMPIILGPDGPSLGGFVCPFVVVDADLWKLGQLAPGHTLSFQCIDPDEAAGLRRAQQAGIAALDPALLAVAQNVTTSNDLGKRDPVLATTPADAQRPAAVYRRQGERNVLVEYGPIVLDLALRFRVHALMLRLQAMSLPGLLDLTPGIRSLQIQFDPDVLSQDKVLALLQETDACLGNLDEVEVPTRTVYLPLSWNDPAVAQTIARYGATVRNDAPWCPDNIEFIRRINGLDSADAVRRLIFDAAYLVMGLGDVYLGAPVATPLDPRHRLVTTKYNPARTWTPPNVVGIGGAYLCIYGMEGPGGYQLFGRTIQVWNSFARNTDFRDGKPWLLRFFDQIRFFPVSDAELVAWRRDFPFGRRHVRIEEGRFRWREYRAFLDAHRDDIARFEQARRTSFDAERLQWERLGEFNRAATEGEASQVTAETALAVDIPPGCELIEAPLNGIVWQVAVEPGAHVKAGEAVAMVEAMKMQCDVRSHCDGVIRAVYAKPSQAITAGAAILAIAPDAP